MSRLETFVRPALAPDVRPIPTPIVRESTEPEDRIITIGGNGSAGINLNHTLSISYSRQQLQETARLYDVVRVKNQGDPTQFVDVDVTHRLKMQNEKGDAMLVKLKKPPPASNVEILRENQVA